MSRLTEESLTLDMDARSRAADALGAAFCGGYRPHFCSEWLEDDACTICWEVAAAVIRAAEGLRKCGPCAGSGLVAPGACCPECDGNGLEVIPA